MNRLIDIAVVLGAATLLAACSIERDVHLYPANDIAAATGVINARLIGHGTLHGTMEATMPDGELLQGEYSIVAGGAVNFGSIFGSAYGTGGAASISGTTCLVTDTAHANR